MKLNVTAYIPGESPVHACDARVKILLLIAYSVTIFVVRTWPRMGVMALLFVAAALATGIPLRRFFSLMTPVYVIAGFSVLFNAFALDVSQAGTAAASGLGNVSAGVFARFSPVALVGTFGFVPEGFGRGCFYAARIVLLVVMSLVLTYTSTSTDLTAAFTSFLRPLRRLRVPVDDIAMVLSIALRFIPLTAEELVRVRDAQWSRGASFGTGSVWQRLRAWGNVFIPLFVGLFRRADALAVSMDSRCYGAPDVVRTALNARRMDAASAAALAVGLVACVALCVV